MRLAVEDHGYDPAAVQAQAGLPTRLDLVTHHTGGCTRAFVVASRGIQQVLPASGTTSLNLGEPEAGVLRYTCGMGMYSGRILFAAR